MSKKNTDDSTKPIKRIYEYILDIFKNRYLYESIYSIITTELTDVKNDLDENNKNNEKIKKEKREIEERLSKKSNMIDEFLFESVSNMYIDNTILNTNLVNEYNQLTTKMNQLSQYYTINILSDIQKIGNKILNLPEDINNRLSELQQFFNLMHNKLTYEFIELFKQFTDLKDKLETPFNYVITYDKPILMKEIEIEESKHDVVSVLESSEQRKKRLEEYHKQEQMTEIDRQKHEIITLTRKNDTLVKQNKEIQMELGRLNDSIGSYTDEISYIRDLLDKKNDEMEAIKKTIKELRTTISELRGDLELCTNKLAEQKQLNKSYENIVDDREEIKKVYENKYTVLFKKYVVIFDQLQYCEIQKREVESALKTAKQELLKCNDTIKEHELKYDETIKEHDGQKEVYLTTIEKLKKQIMELSDKIKALEADSDVQILRTQKQNLETKIKALQDVQKKYNDTLETLKEQESYINVLKQLRKENYDALIKLRDEYRELQNTSKQQSLQIEDLEGTQEKLLSEINLLKSALDSKRDLEKQLEECKKILRDQQTKSTTTYDELHIKYRNELNKNEMLQKEHEKCLRELEIVNARKKELEDKLNKLDQIVKESRNRVPDRRTVRGTSLRKTRGGANEDSSVIYLIVLTKFGFTNDDIMNLTYESIEDKFYIILDNFMKIKPLKFIEKSNELKKYINKCLNLFKDYFIKAKQALEHMKPKPQKHPLFSKYHGPRLYDNRNILDKFVETYRKFLD